MAIRMRPRFVGWLLVASVAAACSSATTSLPSSVTSSTPSPTSAESPAATPAPSAPSGSSQSAGATAGSGAVVSSWYPWLPPPDPNVEATFEPDSFVAARVGMAPVSETPGGPPYRFDTGDPDPSAHPLIGFPRGMPLVVLHGPVVVQDVEWYLLAPAQLAVDTPIGWSPIRSSSGQRLVEAKAYDCLASPIDAARLTPSALTDGLPACYGNIQITIVGDLECDDSADAFVAGASWLAGGACRFGAPPTVYGLGSALEPGRYAVTGRFLDDEAKACRSTDGDDSDHGRLIAVLQCRRAFVATSARPSGA